MVIRGTLVPLFYYQGELMNYYFVDGTLCHINFKGNVGNEINSIHLGVLFNYPGIDGLVH